jgi:hypothetical protein
MKAQDFDQAFENGDDIVAELDLAKATRPGLAARRVNVDFPEWLLKALDLEAARAGVARQALIKVWLAERIRIEVASR